MSNSIHMLKSEDGRIEMLRLGLNTFEVDSLTDAAKVSIERFQQQVRFLAAGHGIVLPDGPCDCDFERRVHGGGEVTWRNRAPRTVGEPS